MGGIGRLPSQARSSMVELGATDYKRHCRGVELFIIVDRSGVEMIK